LRTITDIGEMRTSSACLRAEGRVIGLVPTMGYLHDGHLRLIRMTAELADSVVVSLFVNPTQFGPSEDYGRYPRDLARDTALAEDAGCTVLFAPETRAMYPEGHATIVRVTGLADRMCGAARPGHFDGVATVVAKLLNIVRPHLAVFGQKDAQQATIIERMVLDLDMGVEIIRGPIVREPDGLAMSSRNSYLSGDERADATVLFEALGLGRSLFRSGATGAAKVLEEMRRLIESKASARVQYIVAVDPQTLEDLPELRTGAMLAMAVFIGETRLIDNLVL
jgi:pantoate--beta-alanine ligase